MDKVKKFISKQSVGFYIGVVAALLMLIGTIMLATNCNMTYFRDYNAIVPLLGSLAVIVTVSLLVLKQFVKIPHLETLWIVVILLIGIALMIMISMRVEAMAIILGSELEAGNEIAQSAMSNFIAGAIITIISIVATIVASFFDVTKEN